VSREGNLTVTREMQLVNYALGVCGESSEIAELVVKMDKRLEPMATEMMACAGRIAEITKKHVFHRHPGWEETRMKIRKELGDYHWYGAQLADVLGFTLEEVCTENITTLLDRHPDGFSAQASADRKAA
jgi:NTP pyrophosphatase (non-canonical NTP hydrolase)